MTPQPPILTRARRTRLAWHITNRCNLACAHCLRLNDHQRRKRDLSTDQCLALLDSFLEFVEAGARDAEIRFEGRNPLSRRDFFEILDATHQAKARGALRRITMLGNPEPIDEATAEALRARGVESYGLSLDGMEATNDAIRGRGNFRAAIRALRNLRRVGIETPFKITLIRRNADELIDMLRLLSDEGINQIGIGQLILAGNGEKIADQALTPDEQRAVNARVSGFLDALGPERGALRAALGRRFGRVQGPEFARGGPWDRLRELLFVVWPDGEVVLRRGMSKLGEAPRMSFQEIYDAEPVLRLMEAGYWPGRGREAIMAQVEACRACPHVARCDPFSAGARALPCGVTLTSRSPRHTSPAREAHPHLVQIEDRAAR